MPAAGHRAKGRVGPVDHAPVLAAVVLVEHRPPPPRRLPPACLPPRPRRQARPRRPHSPPPRRCLDARRVLSAHDGPAGGAASMPPRVRWPPASPLAATSPPPSSCDDRPAERPRLSCAGFGEHGGRATPRRADWTPSSLLAGEDEENGSCPGRQPGAVGFVSSSCDGRNVKPSSQFESGEVTAEDASFYQERCGPCVPAKTVRRKRSYSLEKKVYITH